MSTRRKTAGKWASESEHHQHQKAHVEAVWLQAGTARCDLQFQTEVKMCRETEISWQSPCPRNTKFRVFCCEKVRDTSQVG